MEHSDHLLIIDGTNLVRRVFEGNREPDIGIKMPQVRHAAWSSLRRALSKHPHSHAVAVFDAPGKNWRHTMYPQYKQSRLQTPPALRDLVEDLLCEIPGRLGLHALRHAGVEADDVIATLVKHWRARARGTATVLSTDKDLCALIGDGVEVYDHFAKQKIDADWVRAKFGVEPEQLQDYLALVGDPTDDIPGVPSIGKKTAAGLLRDFRTLDRILENRSLQPPARKICAHRAEALLSRSLVGFRTDIILGLSWGSLTRDARNGLRP